MAAVDLLLIRPPEPPRPAAGLTAPIGLLYVAAAARSAGWTVGLIDAPATGMGWGRLRRAVRRAAPAVIGLGGFTPTFSTTARAARELRSLTDAVIVGGAHATAVGAAILERHRAVDAVVRGEAEPTVAPLLRWLDGGRRGPPPPGVVAREGDGGPRSRPDPLDDLPRPALDLVDLRRYHHPLLPSGPLATLVTGRGCPRRCLFCDKGITGSLPRVHGVDRVLDELTNAARVHGARQVILHDDDLATDRARALELCHRLARADLGLRFKCEVRADALDRQLATALRRAGCHTVAVGVESLSRRSLDWLRKDVSPGRIRGALAAGRGAGLRVLAYALVGIPGESVARVVATARACRAAGATWLQLSTLSPFPGTPLERLARDRGWLRETAVTGPADAERLRPTLVAPPWTEGELRRALRAGHAAFYGDPRTAAHLLRHAVRDGSVRSRLGAGIGLARWMAGWP